MKERAAQRCNFIKSTFTMSKQDCSVLFACTYTNSSVYSIHIIQDRKTYRQADKHTDTLTHNTNLIVILLYLFCTYSAHTHTHIESIVLHRSLKQPKYVKKRRRVKKDGSSQ